MSGRGPSQFVRHAVTALCLAWLAMGWPSPATAQPSWEYSPYQIRVWLAYDASGLWDATMRDLIEKTLAARVQAVIGAPWSVVWEPPPEPLQANVLHRWDTLAGEYVAEMAPEAMRSDKIFVLRFRDQLRWTEIEARELDCRTRHWSATVTKRQRHHHQVPETAFTSLIEAFRPIVRIERGETKTALVRLRAGGLVIDPDSPAYVDKGEVFLPIIRTNDRYGKPLPGRITEVPWTLLQVVTRDTLNPNLLICNVHSGMRAPLRGRTSARKERYGLFVPPANTPTRLVVQLKPRTRDTEPTALPDVEVYAKTPLVELPPETPEEAEKAQAKAPPAQLIGRTDWRGLIEVPPADQPLQILYIKSGGQLLARLPIVAGRVPEQFAQLPDDSPRLQAEGYIKGLSGELMDLVAQRQILAARIRKRINEGKLDEAEKLMEEFRALKTRNDILRLLDTQMRRQVESPYPSVQARIDKLYADTRAMIGKYLDPNLGNQLLQELKLAKSKGSTSSSAKAAPSSQG